MKGGGKFQDVVRYGRHNDLRMKSELLNQKRTGILENIYLLMYQCNVKNRTTRWYTSGHIVQQTIFVILKSNYLINVWKNTQACLSLRRHTQRRRLWAFFLHRQGGGLQCLHFDMLITSWKKTKSKFKPRTFAWKNRRYARKRRRAAATDILTLPLKWF